jgi:transcriptional regulator with XRE-family HTH domain
MTEEYIDEAPLTRFGAELQRILDGRELSLAELADVVTEAGYRVEPGLIKLWMTGESIVDIEFLRTLVDALGLETREEMGNLLVEHMMGGQFAQAETGRPTATAWWALRMYQRQYRCECRVHKLLRKLVSPENNPGGYPALYERLEAAGYDFSRFHLSRAMDGEEKLDAELVAGIARVLELEEEDRANLAVAYLEHLEQEPTRPIEMVTREM